MLAKKATAPDRRQAVEHVSKNCEATRTRIAKFMSSVLSIVFIHRSKQEHPDNAASTEHFATFSDYRHGSHIF